MSNIATRFWPQRSRPRGVVPQWDYPDATRTRPRTGRWPGQWPFPRDLLYELAGQIPAVDWRFAQDRSLVDRIRGLALTFTRTTGRTFVQADGSNGSVGVNEAAFSYSGGVSGGLDVWEARTNLFLNSGTPATQGITLTAAAHTLSFKGTGTVTLTGASTAGPLVGTGASNRVTLTFTPSAGVVTFTISGSITEPQVELGANASPYIATAGSTVQRTSDVCSTTDLSWFNAAGGVFYAEWSYTPLATANRMLFSVDDGTANNRVLAFHNETSANYRITQAGNAYTPGAVSSTALAGKTSVLYQVGTGAVGASSGSLGAAGTTLPTAITGLSTFRVGTDQAVSQYFNGTISRLAYFPPGPAAQRLQRMTTQ